MNANLRNGSQAEVLLIRRRAKFEFYNKKALSRVGIIEVFFDPLVLISLFSIY